MSSKDNDTKVKSGAKVEIVIRTQKEGSLSGNGVNLRFGPVRKGTPGDEIEFVFSKPKTGTVQGDNLELVFGDDDDGYVPPEASAVIAQGFFSEAFGAGLVAYRVRDIQITGLVGSSYGTAKIINAAHGIRATGLLATLFGRAQAELSTRYIKPGGFNASALPNNAQVINFHKNVNPVGLPAPTTPSPKIENLSKHIRVTGFAGSSIRLGTPWVSNFTQRVYLQGFINKSAVGRPGVEWPYLQTAAPRSLVPLVFGMAFVDQTSRRVTLTAGVATYAVGGPRVWFHTRGIYVRGEDYLSMGRPEVAHDVVAPPVSQTLVVPGVDVAAYGRAKIESTFKTVYPDGLSTPRFPTPSVAEYDSRTFVYVNGMSTYMVTTPQIKQPYQLIGSKFWGDPQPSTQVGDQTVFGLHKFDWYTRYLQASGRLSSVVSAKHGIRDRAFYPQALPANSGEVFGKLDVGHEIRYIRMSGAEYMRYGAASARLEKASIYVPFLFGFASGVAVVSDGVRSLSVAGIPSSEAVGGRSRVEYFARVVRATSWGSQILPVYAWVRDARQYIGARSINPPDFIVNAIVENRIRFIQVRVYKPPGVDAASYGTAFIRDRTAHILPSSVNQWRIGVGVTVYDFRGDIYSAGVQGHERILQPMIAYRIRTIPLSGVSSLVMPVYTHVRNAAAQILPSGINSMEVGASYILNLARYYKVPSLPSPSTVIGDAFIAAKVRTVGPYGLRSTAYIMQTHWVSMVERSIRHVGFKSDTFYLSSDMEVYERFNRIRPYWSTQSWSPFGEASLTLRNKTFRPHGYDYAEVSTGLFIELYIRTLHDVSLGDTNVFGRGTIKDRRLFVQLQGFGFSNAKLSITTTVRNLLPDPPWTRTVIHGGYPDLISQVPLGANVRLMALVAQSVYGGSGVGSPVLRPNAINVGTGISNYDWGVTQVIGPRFVSEVCIPPRDVLFGADTVMGLPRLSPFHIYAPYGEETPKGYRPIPQGSLHVIDGYISGGTKNGIRWIPAPRVEHKHRVLRIYGEGPIWPPRHPPIATRIFNALIPKSPQYVFLKGASHMRVGWLQLSPFAQTIYAIPIRSSNSSDAHKVVELPAFIRSVYPIGARLDTAVPKPVVDYYNREVYPRGFDALLTVRQIIWFAKHYIEPSGRMSGVMFGQNSWVSNKIRYLEVQGLDAFNPEVAFYRNDTQVRNRYVGDVISVPGVLSLAVGSPDVDRYTKHVRTRGIYPIPLNRVEVKSSSVLSAQGFEASMFGNMRKWGDNLIQVHEYQEPSAGMPVVSTPRQVQGFASSVVDYPVIAAHIGPQGIESEGTGATVFKNEICCGGCG